MTDEQEDPPRIEVRIDKSRGLNPTSVFVYNVWDDDVETNELVLRSRFQCMQLAHVLKSSKLLDALPETHETDSRVIDVNVLEIP